MATFYGVNRTLVRAGTTVDARKSAGPVHVMLDSYVFNSTASGSIIELELLVKTGDIIVDFLVIHGALGTSVTLEMGFLGASASAILAAYAAAAVGTASPDSQAADVVAGSITNALQGAIGVPATSDQRVVLTTGGATTAATNQTVIVILWVASQP